MNENQSVFRFAITSTSRELKHLIKRFVIGFVLIVISDLSALDFEDQIRIILDKKTMSIM